MALKAVDNAPDPVTMIEAADKADQAPRKQGWRPRFTVGPIGVSMLMGITLSGWMIWFCWYKSGLNPTPLEGQAILARHMLLMVLYLGVQIIATVLARVKELSTAVILTNGVVSAIPLVIGMIAVVNHFQGIINLTWYMPQLVLMWMLVSAIDALMGLGYAFNMKGRLFGGMPVNT